jgi:hypothetical protein
MSEYVDTAGAAALLGLSPKTMRWYRANGRAPEPDLWVSGSPAWKVETIRGWDRTSKPKPVHTPIDWANVDW